MGTRVAHDLSETVFNEVFPALGQALATADGKAAGALGAVREPCISPRPRCPPWVMFAGVARSNGYAHFLRLRAGRSGSKLLVHSRHKTRDPQ
jgi:hypothetical protein